MPNKENAKQQIVGLIEKYNKVKEENRVNGYNEEMTKKDFILPLFRILGWNTEDSSEVTAEENVSKKRVDYGFRINGILKFFLEAKSLKENLDDLDFIKQAINYSWLKGCTWAVLTNFETIKIFNAEWKTSEPFQSHLKTISYQEFLDRFDELWLLSKESFEQGLLDKEAEKWGKRTKRIPVDKQLLADFTRFRELLSKSITKLNQNKNITEEKLDESVQKILDRLIFIRNCEDRGYEEKTLLSNLREWESKGKGQLIDGLREVFSYFGKQYNSEIFRTNLCDSLEIDSGILREIIEGLYYTKDKSASYDFSAIEADVLGNIYEQYLGHILKKSEKRAKLLESHVHRKEQGIYYTPTYIVDYIVRNTLGELLKNTKIDPEKIRVLDPACGSGSFLLKVFDILNEYYKEHDKNYSQAQIDTTGTGTTYSRKLKILQNNIFGVDLDEQAVEIARLNLLLKIAEKGQRLPLLQKNIECGNSLIDDPNVAGDKAFMWEEEFNEIMDDGGFDVIVGNPPYISNKEIADKDKVYYRKNYKFATKQFDIYTLFIESAYRHLKEGGRFGFIIPDAFLSRSNMSKLREFLLRETSIESIFILNNVFADPSVASAIIIFKKERPNLNHIIKFTKAKDLKDATFGKLRTISIKQNIFLSLPGNAIIFATNDQIDIIKKIMSNCKPLAEFSSSMFRGEELGKEASVITSNAKDALMFLAGEDIGRYNIRFCNKFIKKSDVLKGTERYLQEKIVIRQIGDKINATLDSDGKFITIQSVYNIIVQKDFDPKCILGIINSKVIEFYYKLIFGSKQLFPRILLENLKQLPIKELPEKDASKLAMLVDKILNLNKDLRNLEGKMSDDTIKIEEEIKKTDAEIDELVYKIYSISDREKKIIEESLK